MNEQLQENTQPTEKTDALEQREYSAIELKAIDQGWIPEEEFDGDTSEFISAPEFVRRGELFGKIESQSKSIKRLEQALNAFKTHHTKVKETEYNRALTALKDERRRLLVEGEHDRAFAIEDKIEEVQNEKNEITRIGNEPTQQDNGEYTAQFQEWVSKNDWYESNRVMRKAADALGLDFHNEGHSPAEVLRMVEREIKKEFSEKFNRKQPIPTVESSTRSTNIASNFSMSDDEKKIMTQIVASGVMTKEEYIKELKRTR